MDMQNEISYLRLAERKDKPTILNIITKAFQTDPGLTWMLESSKNKEKLNVVINFLVEETFNKGSIYLTNDSLGVALWHSDKKEKFSLNLLRRYILMPFKLNIFCIIRLLKFQNITHKQFPTNQAYCYLANIAVLPEAQGKGIASKLMNPIIEECKNKNIPVFLETANANNVEIYKKKGFAITDTINFDTINFYYMKHSCGNNSTKRI